MGKVRTEGGSATLVAVHGNREGPLKRGDGEKIVIFSDTNKTENIDITVQVGT